MDDLDTDLTMLEERIAELREDSLRQKEFSVINASDNVHE
jgi:hypothetical protein